jgi:hypothetical protein
MGVENAVLAGVTVQSALSQLGPQVNHSPCSAYASTLSRTRTCTPSVALVTVALSGKLLVSHRSKPTLTL